MANYPGSYMSPAQTILSMGLEGLDGIDGIDGMDGDLLGLDGLDGLEGLDGIDGMDGIDGDLLGSLLGLDGVDGMDGVDVMGAKRRRQRSVRKAHAKATIKKAVAGAFKAGSKKATQLAQLRTKAAMQKMANTLAAAGNLPGGLRSCQVEPKMSCGPQNARQILPFDSVTTIAAGATLPITTRPQVRFQPDRVFVGNLIADFFLLNDIKIGNRSQFSANGSIPADIFGPQAVNTIVHFDPVDIAQDVVLNVTNIDVAAHRFNGGMIGNACA